MRLPPTAAPLRPCSASSERRPAVDRAEVRPGAWVRFYRNGTLVIGVVQYSRPTDRWGSGGEEVLTDIGSVDISGVLEARNGK